MSSITVASLVRAPIERVWQLWSNPDAICIWNTALPGIWHTTAATVDLRVGGRFHSRMEAKDGSAGFDFDGTYTRVEPQALIAYTMDDGRKAEVEFSPGPEGVYMCITFDAETAHSLEQQREGWQAILDNFARHAETRGSA